MKSGYDINVIQGDGYLVIPISIAKITTEQKPEKIYDIIKYWEGKLATFSNDVIILYTTGLYFNAEDLTHKKRVEMNSKVLAHSNGLRKLIQKKKRYMPNAFHFLPIDYVILNSKDFTNFFHKLKKLEKKDKKFRECVKKDIGNREYNEANVNFILEELAVTHIIRQRLVDFPRTLVRNDLWRLIIYPGKYIDADLYQWKNDILPKEDKINKFSGAQYDFSKKKLFVFDDIEI
jgi:hypothetical protein